MLFPKENVRIVDMCIYIDAHIYESDRDEEKLYKYLYFIAYALSKKGHWLNSEEEYDDFSSYVATEMWVRYNNPKQFENPPRLLKIKSVLNYMKLVLYGMKVDFAKEYGFQEEMGSFNSKYMKDMDYNFLTEYYRGGISSKNNEIIKGHVIEELNSIPKAIQFYLKKSPYKNDRIMMKNIYTSCLLTALSSVALTNQEKAKLNKIAERKENYDISSINSKPTNDVILWKVPLYLEDYIRLIVKNAREYIADQIKEDLALYSTDQRELEDVVKGNYSAVVTEELVDNA